MKKLAVPFNNLEVIVKHLISFSVSASKNRIKDNRKIINQISSNGYLLNSYSQFPLSNGVFDFSLEEHKLEKQLKKAVEVFNEFTLPFAWWWLKNTPIPEKIVKKLAEMGFFSAGEYSGVICDLMDKNFSNNSLDDVKVHQVINQNDYDIFSNIISETFQLPEIVATEFKLALNPTSENDHRFSNFLGYYRNEPVTSLTMFHENNIVGLYAGATLPEARNRGVATAAIKFALQIAISKGYKQAIAQLMAKNMAAGICKRLGFKTVCHFTPYIYGTPADGLEP